MHSKLESIVNALNVVLQENLQKTFTVGTMLFRGIAKPIHTENEILNCVIEKGKVVDITNVVFSDRYDLQVYHKIVNPINLANDINNYYPIIRGQARLQSIIYTKNDRLLLLEEFVKAIPDTLKVKGLQTVFINSNAVNTNEPQIFAQERGNQIPYQLNKPAWQLASIEYTINYSYAKNC